MTTNIQIPKATGAVGKMVDCRAHSCSHFGLGKMKISKESRFYVKPPHVWMAGKDFQMLWGKTKRFCRPALSLGWHLVAFVLNTPNSVLFPDCSIFAIISGLCSCYPLCLEGLLLRNWNVTSSGKCSLAPSGKTNWLFLYRQDMWQTSLTALITAYRIMGTIIFLHSHLR